MTELTDDAIESAFKHLEVIAELHHRKSPNEQLEAIQNVMESFGMDDQTRHQLIDSVLEFVPSERHEATGWVLMGFIAGLSAAQNASESV